MYIKLPEYYYCGKGFVIGEHLYLNKILSFEKIMYKITYEIYGHRCVYCGKKLNKEILTLDHLYPRAIGGVSITNNLKPSCQKCNSAKGDKTEEQYYIAQKLEKRELKEYNADIREWKEQIYKNQGFYLPQDWYINIDVKDIKGIVNKNSPIGKSYYNILGFYTTYNHFPKPIIIDKDFNLLDGYNIMLVANSLKIKKVPAIWCENVRY